MLQAYVHLKLNEHISILNKPIANYTHTLGGVSLMVQKHLTVKNEIRELVLNEVSVI